MRDSDLWYSKPRRHCTSHVILDASWVFILETPKQDLLLMTNLLDLVPGSGQPCCIVSALHPNPMSWCDLCCLLSFVLSRPAYLLCTICCRQVVAFADIPGIREKLPQMAQQLDVCQRALADFLEDKRSQFPRFYFLGDDDLLEILGQVKNCGKSHYKTDSARPRVLN